MVGNYIQIQFQNITTEQSDMLVAELSQQNFEGFEEDETSLKAFIPEKDFDEEVLNEIASLHKLSFQKTIIEETNWNQVWESNFEPVIVDDFVSVRAEFHEPEKNTEHEIIITPKMSFGTGHHATTYMMIRQMRDIDFKDKRVFDFGTGTGVLAILAEKLGAKEVLATDNDEWSINNATENIERNNCSKINVQLSSVVPAEKKFNIILANINKNVILENLSSLKNQLSPMGILLLSGLLIEDKEDIVNATEKLKFKVFNIIERNNWLSIRLKN